MVLFRKIAKWEGVCIEKRFPKAVNERMILYFITEKRRDIAN